MLDFYKVKITTRKGRVELSPAFHVGNVNDILFRGGDFYAVWDEAEGLWSTDKNRLIEIIDRDLYSKREELIKTGVYDGQPIDLLLMSDGDSKQMNKFNDYGKNQMMHSPFTQLDTKILFANEEAKKDDYVSQKLNYSLTGGTTEAWDTLIGTLYSKEEKAKIEWAIGAIVTGASKYIQKCLVFYGEPGAGKSTVLNIVSDMFPGYCAPFSAKSLGNSSRQFALEPLKDNPLIGIDHDTDLSKLDDNTVLNQIISHEVIPVNVKNKSMWRQKFQTFLLMATNKPIKITDSKSGLIRRVIDVNPSGKKVSPHQYDQLMNQIKFEYGAIALRCKNLYLMEPNKYRNHVPLAHMSKTNDIYRFLLENADELAEADHITSARAFDKFKQYCEEANVGISYSRTYFETELSTYFRHYYPRYYVTDEEGNEVRRRNVFVGFKTEKFEVQSFNEEENTDDCWIQFKEQKSYFDKVAKDYPAQLTNAAGTPLNKWDSVTTTLKDIDTHELHYVMPPINHIVIDFDIKDWSGQKSVILNTEAAKQFPPTYAELSKSGAGIHLHYYYDGDPEELATLYSDDVEIKVFKGKMALRRKLTQCNNLKIAHIASGLPKKEKKRSTKEMIDLERIEDEKHLRAKIKKALRKEVHDSTKSNVDYICHTLESAIDQDLSYDIRDMYDEVFSFAAGSQHQSPYCISIVAKHKSMFISPDKVQMVSPNTLAENIDPNKPIVFYDIEVFPNFFCICWKTHGAQEVHAEINPTPERVGDLLKLKLAGFNNRRYDNHIVYARYMGDSLAQLYGRSKDIIAGNSSAMIAEAYNISFTDIYEFAAKKQSLKKWMIELGLFHLENEHPWDEDLPQEYWDEVVKYCKNDVIATEALFDHLSADWTARQILAALAGRSVNSSTNALTEAIIFGNNKTPQDTFNYRFLGDPVKNGFTYENWETSDGTVPFFPGYSYEAGKSTYRGIEVGEGGYVYAPSNTAIEYTKTGKEKEVTRYGGIFKNVALLDVASMHPSSIVDEELFGPTYTPKFQDILNARIAIKHNDFETARTMLDGKLAPYLTDEKAAKELSQALKIAINSVYGLTAAKFNNPCRDKRNVDNIVAKRGALFMVDLLNAVEAKGYTVVHIKTDSIKIADADLDIIDFVMRFGKKYGYNFEHEATYERMCLVNNAVYIARYGTEDELVKLYGRKYLDSDKDICKENKKHPGAWTATGTQFIEPYVFKKLFSKEPIIFEDLCCTKTSKTALYLAVNGREDEGYRFIGKVGSFCPMLEESGAGPLYAKRGDSFASVTGTKGYLWKESNIVKELGQEDLIDYTYFDALCDEAIDTINKYGSFEEFVDI